MRVAVVGSGISGLAVAHRLRSQAQVTLLEAGDYFGGHTHTVDVTLPTVQGQPVTHGVEYTRWQILLYTVLLVVATILPWATHMSGVFYLGGALVLGAVFLWYAWKLLDPPDEFFAMRAFKYSIVYLMALFAFLLLDHWLLPFLQPAAAVEFVPQA